MPSDYADDKKKMKTDVFWNQGAYVDYNSCNLRSYHSAC